jgi:hypothetical protein
MSRRRWYFVFVLLLLLLIGPVTQAAAATYTSTKDFTETSAIYSSYIWQQCVPDLPAGALIESVSVEIRSKIWPWPSSGVIDLLASNTNTFSTNSTYQVCTFTSDTHPSGSTFYTTNCLLKANQMQWLADDKCIYLQMFTGAGYAGTYFLDYSNVTVQTTLPKVANPTFSPAPDVYTSSQQVSISCATTGASIRYTTDGNDPTESSTLYSGSIPVAQTATLKARAYKTGMLPSDVVTAGYIIEPGDETALYLLDKGVLSEAMGDPVPWVTNYVYPDGESTSTQWQTDLGGDIAGVYYYNIDVLESGAPATLKVEFIISQDGIPTTVASHDISVPAIPQGYYQPHSSYINHIDLQTEDGDILIFKITETSGTTRVGIGVDGTDPYNDGHVKVYYRGPVPCFSVTPQKGELGSIFSFDASCSSDNSYSASELEVRWDWENDGTYDTAFSTTKTTTQQFLSSGVKHVKLQVKNPDGLVRTKIKKATIDMVVLSVFSAPGPAPAGLAWDGIHLWLSEVNSGTIYKLTTSGQVLSSFPSPCDLPLDLAFDGQNLWVIDAKGSDSVGNVIYKMDTSGNVVTSFSVPADISTGLTWDGFFLWGSDSYNGRLAKIDPGTGQVIVSFSSPGPSPRGMAWDGQFLWVSDFSTREIYKMNTSGTVLNTFPAPGTGPMGLTWDGKNLWCVDLDSYKIYQITDKIPSAITCQLSDANIILGERITVTGQISPPPGEAGIGVSVELTPSEGDTIYRATLANINGEFEYQLQCSDISKAGAWSVRTSWAGAGPYVGAKSEPVLLTVAPATARITVDSTSQAIKFGETIDISGKFTPQPDCGRDLSGIPLKVYITKPDQSVAILDAVTNDMYGHYVVQDYAGMNALGEWKIEVKFEGTGGYVASSSETVQVRVVETAGYAIVVQGKIENEEGQASHQKTTKFVYKKLKARGLLDNDIEYFTYDTEAPEYDALPSKAGIQEAITQWASGKMNTKPANLYIVMVDHGFNEEFYIHPETVTAAELDSWLDTLQGNLNEQAAGQEIIVLLGFCRSGSFIDNSAGNHRVIIASAAANESSYKGPLDADGIRDGEYFVSEFFKSVALGKSVKESFEEATRLTERFTSEGTGAVNAPYFDDSRQHPLLDDNGDGVGSNDLSDPLGEGISSMALLIGAGTATGNDPEDVTVTEVAKTVFLDETQSTADLGAKVSNNMRLKTIWMEIKAPGTMPIDPKGSGQAVMNLPRMVYLVFNTPLGRYEWPGQGGFTEPGTYQILYFAKDDVTDNVSPFKEGKVYKAKAGNAPPGAFSLVSPGDGATVLTSAVLDWEDAVDPEGDWVTYTVLLSKDDPKFTSPLRKEGLPYSTCLIGPADGVEDLSTYYWKVQAIDEYGAVRESNVRVFNTNNTNPVSAWIDGRVFNAKTNEALTSAVVSVSGLSYNTELGGYYLGEVPPGTHTVTAIATGYRAQSYIGVVIGDGQVVTRDFALTATLLGDVNGDNTVDMADCVLSIRIINGADAGGVDAMAADANGDGKVGLQDVLYILQKAAGLR